MRGDFKFTIFAAGCGDSFLIEAHRKVVLTDIHYRATRARDEEDDEVLDFAPDIRKACGSHLDVFVSTHPDKDHVGGFSELFHCGHPDSWEGDPGDGEPKIIVDEIWCSPYGAAPNYVTDQARALTDEIKRRERLTGTYDGERDGNRLKVMDTTSHTTGSLASGLDWRLLAPTPTEWDIPAPVGNEPPQSSNASSLVIQWTVTRGNGDNKLLLAGDTSVDVLERLERDVHRKNPDHLAWHVHVASHHCSRRSIGRVWGSGTVDEEFEESPGALAAIGEQRGDGFVVASSRRVVRGGNTPPSWHAKQRYLRVLARQGEVTEAVKRRFRCTGGDTNGDKPAHVVFNLTGGGPTLAKITAPALVGLGGVGASVGGGGSYA